LTDTSPGFPPSGSAEPRRPRLSGRVWTLIISAVVTASLLAVAFLLPVPYVRLAPGPTFNVIGEIDGAQVIEIEGTETYPVSGELDMTTVSESGGPRGGLTFVEAIAAWFNASDAVVPRELLYPDDVTGDEIRQRGAALFSTAESDAIAAALGYLDIPVSTEVIVTAVLDDTPADGVLEPRDRIRAIDGVEVTTPQDVVDAVRAAPIGTALALDIERDGDPTQVRVSSVDNPDKPGTGLLGITVGNFYTPDFIIDFTLQDIGGPSAGLVFAMGIVDKLTPDNITGGEHIAVTGTIDPDGGVGSIGGIRQKLTGARDAGAELFLMPRGNCTEAEGYVPEGLTVVPVETLADAIDALTAWRAGNELAACPA
jgi:PDZ domain-containing protein